MTSEIIESKINFFHKKIQSRAKINMGSHVVELYQKEYEKLEKGVFSKLCKLSDDKKTIVDVIFLPNSKLSKHNHPSNFEDLIMLDGTFLETISNSLLVMGDILKIPKGVYHEFYSENGCKCTVVFKPAFLT